MIGTYLVDDATLRMEKGKDEWQEPLTPEDVAIKVFIEYGEFQIQNAQGTVIVSNTRVLMKPRTIITDDFATRAANTISEQDRIIFDGAEHAIMKIAKHRDFSVRGFQVYVT